jgi:Predicted membrane protein
LLYKLLIDRGINYIFSTTISFFIAVSVAYYTNRKWVFRSKAFLLRDIAYESLNFFLARLGTYLFDLLGLVVMIQFLHLDPLYSKIFLNVLIIGFNYLLSKMVIFDDLSYL